LRPKEERGDWNEIYRVSRRTVKCVRLDTLKNTFARHYWETLDKLRESNPEWNIDDAFKLLEKRGWKINPVVESPLCLEY
jgi:hypothetical protein